MLLGCSALSDAEAPQANKVAKPAKPTEPAAKAPTAKASAASPKAAPSPAVRPTDAATTKKAPPDAVADGPVPTRAEIREASSAVITGKLAVLTPIARLGPSTHVVLWRRHDPEEPGEADVVLALVRGTTTAGATAWRVTQHHVLRNVATPWLGDEPPQIAATLKVDDYDDDGEREILVRLRHSIMCGGGGENVVTTMTLLDATPTLKNVLRTELAHEMLASPASTKATVHHEDLNADGHRDIRIVYESEDPSDPESTSTTDENRWIWEEKDDRWTLGSGSYARWGCDW